MSFLSTKHASKPVIARATRHFFCFVLVDAKKGCMRDQIARRKRKGHYKRRANVVVALILIEKNSEKSGI